jgi:Mitochondrial ribosomal death-associated protein 3
MYPHKPVHPHRLWIPFYFTCLLNGTTSRPRTAVVAATSQYPAARTLEIALGEVQQKPYEKIDRRIPHSVAGATIIRPGDQLTLEEAMGLATYYQNTGLLKTVDRFDGVSKSVGDMEYLESHSHFWEDDAKSQQGDQFRFRRRGHMNVGMFKKYRRRNGIIGIEDATDVESTMERLAMAGGTARGFWRVCTRMSHL